MLAPRSLRQVRARRVWLVRLLASLLVLSVSGAADAKRVTLVDPRTGRVSDIRPVAKGKGWTLTDWVVVRQAVGQLQLTADLAHRARTLLDVFCRQRRSSRRALAGSAPGSCSHAGSRRVMAPRVSTTVAPRLVVRALARPMSSTFTQPSGVVDRGEELLLTRVLLYALLLLLLPQEALLRSIRIRF